MANSIVVIGLGSLGGFFAENISKLDGVKRLILVDPDIVEKKNLKNSIYRKRDVGKGKVDALADILEFSLDGSIEIIKIFKEFKEGETQLPEADLVFDCRDVLCSRGGYIDVKMYISFRTLVVDCQKHVNIPNTRRGRYVDHVTKNDIRNAAFNAFLLVYSKKIYDLMRQHTVHTIQLDDYREGVNQSLELVQSKNDLVYESQNGEEKLVNLHENLVPILEANKKQDLNVIIGEKQNVSQKLMKIPCSEMRDQFDVIRVFSELARNIPLSYDRYLIRVLYLKKEGIYIELLPSTGAA